MTPARYTVTAALLHAGKSADKPLPLLFKAQGRELTFDGFLRLYEEPDDVDAEGQAQDEGGSVPALKEGQGVSLVDLALDEAQTCPPSRYSEAALVQALEQRGVGRPSTYASMVAVIRDKQYVALRSKRLAPTETGMKLCDFVVERFPQVFAVSYTAHFGGGAGPGSIRRHEPSRFALGVLAQLPAAVEDGDRVHPGADQGASAASPPRSRPPCHPS